MNLLADLFSNQAFIAAILGWLIAQVLKVIVVRVRQKKIDFRYLISSGGMPSSHSAFVTAMTTAVAFECGLSSPEFAISFVLSFIVMYDASGVRRETGRQAEILNDIIENIGKDTPQVMGKRLKELVGHSPIEVTVGALLGVVIGLILYLP